MQQMAYTRSETTKRPSHFAIIVNPFPEQLSFQGLVPESQQ